jgi:hypothetical protein
MKEITVQRLPVEVDIMNCDAEARRSYTTTLPPTRHCSVVHGSP